MMSVWFAVALGSALGGLARFVIARLWPTLPSGWPLATMSVNVIGSFAIGWCAAFFAARAVAGEASEALRIFWMTGVLGGFTTYSAFALETVTLASTGAAARAAAYALVTVVLCVAAAAAGRALGPG